MTADSGTPIARSAAISGMTPQEQKGESPPASAASTIMRSGEPVKARAIRLSAPVAPAQAAMPIDRTRNGCGAGERGEREAQAFHRLAGVERREDGEDQRRGEPDALALPEPGQGGCRSREREEASVMSKAPDIGCFRPAKRTVRHHAASSFVEVATPAQHSDERKPRSARMAG
jgi:hypothetical protein